MDPQLRTVLVRGCQLAFLEVGTGEPVVFVHGAYSDHRAWSAQFSALTHSYRCVFIDQRYFGQTTGSDTQPYSLASHAADLAEFIDLAAGGAAHVVGTSYGSGVALACAVWSVSRVRSLFLNEPALPSIVTQAEDLATLASARERLGPAIEALTRGDHVRSVELFCDWTSFPGGFQTLPLHLNAPASRLAAEDLGSIRVPTTFSAGTETIPFFRVQVEAAHRAVVHSRLVAIDHAHHGAPFEYPDRFNAALEEHLSDAASPAA